MLQGCSSLTWDQKVLPIKYPQACQTLCEERLPDLQGGTTADILHNRRESVRVYEECRSLHEDCIDFIDLSH